MSLMLLAVTMALNGAPKAEIVYPEGCRYVEKFAAEDLAHWVKEISGAELSVTSATAVARAQLPRVYVGRAFAEKPFAKDLEEIGDTDGFAIREKDGDLYLFGGEPRSAVYATSRLLEDNTDIIWARPASEFGTVFTKNPTLAFKKTDKLEKPLYWLHGWCVGGIRRDHDMNVWALRNGANQADGEPRGSKGSLGFVKFLSGHNFWWVARPKEDFAAHPEYFGYNASTKRREQDTLCLTAPGLVDLAVKKYLARFAESEKDGCPVEAFLLGMRDSWVCCQCETCAAPIVLADGTKVGPNDGEVHASTRYWTFVRDVCTKLREQRPDIRYYGWGYFYGLTPPACELPKWLHCEFCPYGGFNANPYLDPKQNAGFRTRLEKWNELLPGHVSYLEYWFCESSGGVPGIRGIGSAERWQRNMQDMAHVLKGPGLESFIGPDSTRSCNGFLPIRAEWDAAPMIRWLATRLMWNPDQDLGALKKFYYTRTYREAAGTMEKYTELLGRLTHNSSLRPKQRTALNSNERKQLEELLQKAYAEAQHPNAKEMIKRQLDHWMLAKKSSGVEAVAVVAKDEPHREIKNISWQNALELPEFQVPGYFTWGKPQKAKAATVIHAQHDGDGLFLRIGCQTQKTDGDWILVRVNSGPEAPKGAKGLSRVITAADPDVKATKGGYALVLEIPFAQLGIDLNKSGTFPTYEFVRHDAATDELSTPKGHYIGNKSGTFAF